MHKDKRLYIDTHSVPITGHRTRMGTECIVQSQDGDDHLTYIPPLNGYRHVSSRIQRALESAHRVSMAAHMNAIDADDAIAETKSTRRTPIAVDANHSHASRGGLAPPVAVVAGAAVAGTKRPARPRARERLRRLKVLRGGRRRLSRTFSTHPPQADRRWTTRRARRVRRLSAER